MACSRNLGLSTMPLVCVNTNGFYDSFREMLERAWDDKLTKLPPEQIMHFADTPEEAIRWVERVHEDPNYLAEYPKKHEKEMLRHSSALGNPSVTACTVDSASRVFDMTHCIAMVLIFSVGFVSGGIALNRDWTYDE